METEIVGRLADRDEAIRANAKTLPCRYGRTNAVVISGAKMTVACIAARVFELVERAVVL
jgi:hypothetical protein